MFYHNLSGYDMRMFIRELRKEFDSGSIGVIVTGETYSVAGEAKCSQGRIWSVSGRRKWKSFSGRPGRVLPVVLQRGVRYLSLQKKINLLLSSTEFQLQKSRKYDYKEVRNPGLWGRKIVLEPQPRAIILKVQQTKIQHMIQKL